MIRIKVREIAEGQGLNQQMLADKTGLAYSSVTDLWYDRVRRIDKRTLDRLCKTLDVSPGDLLERDGSKDENRNAQRVALQFAG